MEYLFEASFDFGVALLKKRKTKLLEALAATKIVVIDKRGKKERKKIHARCKSRTRKRTRKG